MALTYRRLPVAPAPSPPGIRVPRGGSCCANCMYVTRDGQHCINATYIALSYRGKIPGDGRFIDGKTGRVVADPLQFCCNVYDWPG